MSSSDVSVSFVLSTTTLLSGGLEDCVDVDDNSCEGGISLVLAYLRQYSQDVDEASLVLSSLDYQSTFVQMHPLSWSVNRLILRDYFGMQAFFANPSLLEQHKADSTVSQRDLSGLQTNTFHPVLHGNVVPVTTNSWSQYTKNVHFDEATGLAVIFVQGQFISTGSITSLAPEDTAKALINYVVQENRAQGCSTALPYDAYFAGQTNRSRVDFVPSNSTCWKTVLVKTGGGYLEPFISAISEFENQPDILINTQSHVDSYEVPQKVGNMWVVSYEDSSSWMRQIRLSYLPESVQINNVTLIEHSLSSIPNSTKDDQLVTDIAYMHDLAMEAMINDPVQGQSLEMPVARSGDYRACFGGECPIGNLFTDSLRWYTGADFAFIQSGGVRGGGWSEGPVKVSDIWSALPFANTQCTGTISGVTLFKLFDLATQEAQFVSNIVMNGDRLFQVSGIRYTYNTQMEAPRLISLEILDSDSNQFVPVERLKLYKYATSSWMCSGFDPYPAMLSDELVIEGEESSEIGDQLLQSIVGEYLQYAHQDVPYNTTIQGRLVNDTLATVAMNLVQTEDGCNSTTYWVEANQTCYDCPTSDAVALSGSVAEFDSFSGVDFDQSGVGTIQNGAFFSVSVAMKSKPSWVSLAGGVFSDTSQRVTIAPNQSVSFTYSVTAANLDPGVASGALSFAVLQGGSFTGCVGHDLVFELTQNIARSPELAQEGKIRIVGFSMVSILSLVSLAFAGWVYLKREEKAVRMMQPVFLLAICMGVFVIGLSILPRSLVGWSELSDSGNDFACMANAWLLTMGFCFVMSALLAKLWRINHVVNSARAFRRTSVSVKDAALHFSVQFVVNLALMLAWTFIDPMRYVIKTVEGESWRLYGTCTIEGTSGWVFMCLTIAVNFSILVLAMYEAYRARKLGEEYSESAGLGLAIFSWLQMALVGVPVLFLLDDDSVNPRYFLTVSLTFACCISMLLFIFAPIVVNVGKAHLEAKQQQERNLRRSSLLRQFSTGLFGESTRLPKNMIHAASAPPRFRSDGPSNTAGPSESAYSCNQSSVSYWDPEAYGSKVSAVDVNTSMLDDSDENLDLSKSDRAEYTQSKQPTVDPIEEGCESVDTSDSYS